GEGAKPYGKPAAGARSYGKPADGEKRYSRPAGAGTASRSEGAKPYGKPAAGARSYGKPADGEKRYGRPSGGSRPVGSSPRPFNRSPRPFGAGNRPSSRPPYGRAPEAVETTGLTLNARRVALDVLQEVHEKGAYASLSLNEHLQKAKLIPEDRRLVTSIVYGTLENQLRIDYVLDKLMEHPTREAVQRDILRMSAYQILFLERVPDSAAVNEAVKLVKVMGMEAASGFINAVLRNLVRGKDTIEWPKREDGVPEYISIMSGTPLWLTERFIEDYGEEEAEKLLMTRNVSFPVVVRPNMTKLSDEQFEALLRRKEMSFEKGVAPHSYLLTGVSELALDKDYQNGLFSIQGQSSILAAEAVQAARGMKVLDACAAPGGKSAYLCEKMEMTGRVYAWELHEKRVLLLEAAKRRLKLENLRVLVRDATEYREDWDATLDAVLLDAPCSGTGVLAQKPDIKLRLKEEDISAIVNTQKKLLHTLCRYVKPKGLLVYSTCSILPEENALQIKTFLEEHPEYALEPLPLSFPESLRMRQGAYGVQLLPYRDQVEGFFIARLRRTR
ncbi:MAG: 16S rRNA (cytosine(967)-C(5))-methyltransferase RsmB, partial [Eubacteriales bacterium]|nr:16S rRNA (cytosine(967)-C(5))-methyltransferase RsmB [Eubacteriales bacterium]